MATSSTSPAVPTAEAFPNGTTDYKPLRGNKYDLKKPHIAEQPMTWDNWYQHINWLNTTLIIFIPMMGLVASYWVPLQWKTAVFAVIYYFNTGLGITAGKSPCTD
jgi:stearoyl-CoA desaturase (Delta-9 desaturase)